MENLEKIGCVILNFNDADITIELVKKIEKYELLSKILIVDNCSTDDSFKKLKSLSNEKIEVITSEENKGYGCGNNLGIKHLFEKYSFKHILISNPDVSFEEILLKDLLEVFYLDKNCVISSALQMLPQKKLGKSYWEVPSKLDAILSGEVICNRYIENKILNKYKNISEKYIKVGCVAGSLLLIDVEWFLSVGGYDENVFLYMEESFLGKKALDTNKSTYCCLTQKYLHQHGFTISKFNTFTKKRKILWNSTKIYLEKFYKVNMLEMFGAKLLYCIGTLEILFLKYLKKFLNTFKSK